MMYVFRGFLSPIENILREKAHCRVQPVSTMDASVRKIIERKTAFASRGSSRGFVCADVGDRVDVGGSVDVGVGSKMCGPKSILCLTDLDCFSD